MKIDLVGPARRGLAMGLNEAAGYDGVALTALLTGYLAERYRLRPAPFLLGLAYVALGLGLSRLAVRETRGHVQYESLTTTTSTSALGGPCHTARGIVVRDQPWPPGKAHAGRHGPRRDSRRPGRD